MKVGLEQRLNMLELKMERILDHIMDQGTVLWAPHVSGQSSLSVFDFSDLIPSSTSEAPFSLVVTPKIMKFVSKIL